MSTSTKIEQSQIFSSGGTAAAATAQYSDISRTPARVVPMMAKKSRVRDFLQEFLELYREMPALWKVKSREYNNRCKKTEAYDVLVEKFREMEPDADRELVKRKINSIRTNYRKELKKASTQPGYEPTLWYFDLLSFLREQESVLAATDDGDTGNDSLTGLGEGDKSGSETTEDVRGNGGAELRTVEPRLYMRPQIKLSRQRAATTSADDDLGGHSSPQPNKLLALACEHLRHVNDEYEILTKSWALELRKMRPDQQIYAKKAIHDVLFEGQLATLTRDSVKINEGRNVHPTQTVYCYEGTM